MCAKSSENNEQENSANKLFQKNTQKKKKLGEVDDLHESEGKMSWTKILLFANTMAVCERDG